MSLQRLSLLFGAENTEILSDSRVIIFGVGGVGSWCAEALVRSGVGHLTMVDADDVDPTNINRQLPATTSTIGRPKVEVLKERFTDIRPDADIVGVQRFYGPDNCGDFHLEDFDVVIDAIDSVASKACLIQQATSIPGLKLFSSMGAARRIDPSRVQHAEFMKVKGCALARALRNRFKKSGMMPRRKFKCVFSDEPVSGEPKGTCMMVTAAFGLQLASLAVNECISRNS